MHMSLKKARCLVVTVSDTRTMATDKSGKLIKQLLLAAEHEIVDHIIVKDEIAEIRAVLDTGIERDDVDAILLTGGTGIAKRDVTIEVVQEKLEKELTGFGEIFRMLSYTEDIGSKAILSRAIAGVVGRKVIFALPGSQGAVKLALEKLIIPELGHILSELSKDRS